MLHSVRNHNKRLCLVLAKISTNIVLSRNKSIVHLIRKLRRTYDNCSHSIYMGYTHISHQVLQVFF